MPRASTASSGSSSTASRGERARRRPRLPRAEARGGLPSYNRVHPVKGVLARMVEEELRKAPELREPIEDLSVVTRHQELVDVLMAVVFAPAFWEQEYGAAMVPFHLRTFFA